LRMPADAIVHAYRRSRQRPCLVSSPAERPAHGQQQPLR
jgi:hypothetical protein